MQRYDIDYFKKLAIQKGGICISDKYINCRTKLEFKCACGNIWTAEPRHIIEGRWCPKCGHQKGRKYEINDNFFSTDTEESFYVAGFLAADGWKTRRSGGGFSIGLQLWAEDLDHLKLIRNLMGCTSPLKFRKRKNASGSTSFSYNFIANSEQCYKDLERFGIVENKTYILRIPDWLCKHELVRHFMRGYIDGDGCFCHMNTSKRNDVFFSMRGTKEFLESFHSVLFAAGVCDQEREITANAGKKDLVFGKLQYGGNGIISKMYKFLYNDCTVFLPRKEEIAKKSLTLTVYGDGIREKKHKVTALPITQEILLDKAKELGSGVKIAKYFGCTPANISWWVNNLEIQEEYHKLIGKYKLDYELVTSKYNELKNCALVAKEFGITRQRVAQIVKRASGFNNPRNLNLTIWPMI